MDKQLQEAMKVHQFWGTQPVPQANEEAKEEGPIDEVKTPDMIRQEPYRLPNGFKWVDIDIYNENDAKDVYDLLLENYVEDSDAYFRFAYSLDCMKWALCPPGYKKEYHIGVRLEKTNKLMGFITGTPQTLSIRGQHIDLVDVNFLCVQKKIRSKRLAPVLIKELTRRVNCNGGFQAIYTVGNVIPTPITSTTYYHHLLNPRKMVYIGFSYVPSKISMAGYIKLCRVPEKTSLVGLRDATEADIPVITKKLNAYLDQFPVHPVFTEEEAKHFLLPREGVVHSFVVEDPQTHELTSFFSTFTITSSITNNKKYSEFQAAYAYYYFTDDNSLIKELFQNALTICKDKGADVFNALNIMHNESVFEPLRFHKGDGHLQYYLYNWRLNPIKPSEMGVVLP